MKKEKVKVSANLQKIIDQVAGLSVLELSELVKALEEKFGVSAAAPVAVAAGAAPSGEAGAEAPAEKSEFNIEITSAGDQKIAVIKVVKEITEKGLKDAKDMVDSAPVVVKENVKKEEAEEIKKKLEKAGASVELK